MRSARVTIVLFSCSLALVSASALATSAHLAPPSKAELQTAAHTVTHIAEPSIARASIAAMAAGHWTEATHGFDPVMHDALTPTQLSQIWQQLQAKYGTYAGSGKAISKPAPTPDRNVVVPVTFGKQALGFQYTFDASGKIGGLHLVPAPVQQ